MFATNIALTLAQRTELQRISAAARVHMAALIREALDEWIAARREAPTAAAAQATVADFLAAVAKLEPNPRPPVRLCEPEQPLSPYLAGVPAEIYAVTDDQCCECGCAGYRVVDGEHVMCAPCLGTGRFLELKPTDAAQAYAARAGTVLLSRSAK